MFILKKIITPFILPPGCLIVLFLLLGVAFLIARRRAAGTVWMAAGLIFWGASIDPVAGYFAGKLEAGYRIPMKPQGDAIVLLCGGLIDGAQDLTGSGRPSNDMIARIVTAVRLYRKLGVPIIVTGGKVFDSSSSEAAVAKRFLVDLGVNEKHILLEKESRDTYENAKFTADILKKEQFVRALLVTNGLHMKRAEACFRVFGISVMPVPCSLDSQTDRKATWRDFMPGDYRGISNVLHEIFGWIYYQWAYGLKA